MEDSSLIITVTIALQAYPYEDLLQTQVHAHHVMFNTQRLR